MSSKRQHKEYPPFELIRSMLDYDPDTGIFRWLPRPDRSHSIPGSIAGWIDRFGYNQISIRGRKYLGHRLAWKYVHGVDAPDQIDHINNNPSDNRISNLRVSTQSQNLANKRRKSCAAYPKGVYPVSRRKGADRYVAQLGLDGKTIHAGTFSTPEDAHAAYLAKAKEIHGEFANAG